MKYSIWYTVYCISGLFSHGNLSRPYVYPVLFNPRFVLNTVVFLKGFPLNHCGSFVG